MLLRLSEQSKLTAEQKRLMVEMREKLQEYKDWNVKYNVSHTHNTHCTRCPLAQFGGVL